MESENPSVETSGSGKPVKDPGERRDGSIRRWNFISRKLAVRIIIVLILIGITATIFVYRDNVEDLQEYGYLGAFLISLISTATIILPVPGIAAIYFLGDIYNPFLIGIAAGAGSALGEITGYLAGYSGQVIVENNKLYLRMERWMKHRGSIVIFLLSLVPNPFFDLAGAIAGVLRYPLWKFLAVCFAGKTLKNLIIAYAGYYTVEGVLDFLKNHF